MAFVKGTSGNVKGRPKGIIDKRQRMQKAIGEGADAVIQVIKARALDGDMQAAALLISRLVPTLKPEGAPIRFKHDSSLPTSKQIEMVIAAVAAGQITIEEGLHVAKIVEALATARSIEGGGDAADQLSALFKQAAQAVSRQDGMPALQEAPPVDEE